ncbi:hypothetical protein GRX01_04180 [Halobaculum sp. WSA2]|uniref:Uncharacterized protein n=2 Tax=Halobaculum saliterrae TaxID=2073113 RepID=A0A6B0SP94_9EURY|nr:hypothetical protein [Halobaculum saliterrae]
MGDRRDELEDVVSDLRARDAIADAFIAKSFTDRLVIVDIEGRDEVPADVIEHLADHDLRGAEGVYSDGEGQSFAGSVGDTTRHHFLDMRTRGAHQSYVVEVE